MADWSDYYSGQRVDSLARCVALRHHDARVGGSVPGLGSSITVTHRFNLQNILTTHMDTASSGVYLSKR